MVLRPGATLDTPLIRAWARDRIAGYKMPKVVHALEALPLNATGKVDRRRLQARFAGVSKSSQ